MSRLLRGIVRAAPIVASILSLLTGGGLSAERFSILNYAPSGAGVDRSGNADASQALARAVAAANEKTARGEPACVFLPAGVYRISSAPPAFARAGCIAGEGSSQSIIAVDPSFSGDLFLVGGMDRHDARAARGRLEDRRRQECQAAAKRLGLLRPQ